MQVYLEFNQLYRWHNLVPDELSFEGGPQAFAHFVWNPSKLTQVVHCHALACFCQECAARCKVAEIAQCE